VYILYTIYLSSPICKLMIHIDRKKPPPPGGFPIYYVSSSRTVSERTPSKHLVQILRGGSSYSRFLMREHSKWETPPGGGCSFDQYVCTFLYMWGWIDILYIYLLILVYIYIYMNRYAYTYIYACIYTYIHIFMYMYIGIYIYI